MKTMGSGSFSSLHQVEIVVIMHISGYLAFTCGCSLAFISLRCLADARLMWTTMFSSVWANKKVNLIGLWFQ